MSAAIVAAARQAIGTPFRLHGRDPALGLDCVGLVAFALEAGGGVPHVPSGYALRSGDRTAMAAMIERAGLVAATAPGPGDVLLCRAGPGQLHLVIDIDGRGGGIIHADAQLRRVVERPGPLPWPEIGRWRLAPQET
jgi:cell wall-associated NlpC family hydrolase